jgi:hypothetical protein
MPGKDLGLRNALAKAYGMAKPPAPKELIEFAEKWRPYRTAAAWYLWQSLRVITPEKPVAPKPARTVAPKPARTVARRMARPSKIAARTKTKPAASRKRSTKRR